MRLSCWPSGKHDFCNSSSMNWNQISGSLRRRQGRLGTNDESRRRSRNQSWAKMAGTEIWLASSAQFKIASPSFGMSMKKSSLRLLKVRRKHLGKCLISALIDAWILFFRLISSDVLTQLEIEALHFRYYDIMYKENRHFYAMKSSKDEQSICASYQIITPAGKNKMRGEGAVMINVRRFI